MPPALVLHPSATPPALILHAPARPLHARRTPPILIVLPCPPPALTLCASVPLPALGPTQMDAVNEMRLQDAQQRHEQLLEDIRQLNAKHRQEFQDKVKAKKVRGRWDSGGAC